MNQTKKQKELIKLFSNLTYIDIERGKIIEEVGIRNDSALTSEKLEQINYWIEKDLKSLQKTLEYINEII